MGPSIKAKLMENVMRSDRMGIQDYGNDIFRVIFGKGDLTVDLNNHTCSYNAWDMNGMPCLHACDAIKSFHENVYKYVDKYLTQEAQEKIYNKVMIAIETYVITIPDILNYDDYRHTVFLQPPFTTWPPERPRTQKVESQF
ncbi:uncharacterized protein LOC129317518 [Prosopis cineraria]|uniref:uncharacterized protein LOC129317518 n=1 Tax=Prosopis cineraria TaxID=364024 RepID=UPI00240F1A69|nr:uncharacterized protein LOC129317518 [Prosopis cineraria]